MGEGKEAVIAGARRSWEHRWVDVEVNSTVRSKKPSWSQEPVFAVIAATLAPSR